MTTFLDEIAEKINSMSVSPERVTVVMANRRAALFLKRALIKKANKPMLSPKMLAVEEFIEGLSGLTVLPQTALIFKLYEAYKSVLQDKADSFDDYLKWANTVLQDFNEIDRYLVDHHQLYTNLRDIKKIEQWDLKDETEVTNLMNNYIVFWEKLPEIFTQFRDLLLHEGSATQGLAYRVASEKIKSGEIKIDLKNFFLFAGFNAMNKAEEEIIKAFLNSGNAEMYFDADKYYFEDGIQEAGTFLRKVKNEWPWFGNHEFSSVGNHFASHPKIIKAFATSGNIAQAKMAGKIVEDLPEINEKTALVLADETQLIPVVQSLPDHLEKLNITMGIAMARLPISIALSSYLDMMENAVTNPRVSRGKSPAFYYKSLNQVLQSELGGFLTGGNSQKNVVLDQVKRQNLVYQTPVQFFERFEILEERKTFWEIETAPLKLVKKLGQLVSAFAGYKTNADKTELETMYALYKILGQLEKYMEAHPVVQNVETLRALFHNLLKDETLSFYGEPLTGLQLLGVLETRNLDFETVIITSLNEGVLPAGKSTNSFIPYDLKREHQLPTYEEKDAIYAYHFYRLLQRAKKVYFLYTEGNSGLGGGEKSRFIEQLKVELPKKANGRVEITSVETPARSENLRTPLHVEKTDLVIEALRSWAERGISPSSINAYNRDPYDFYLTYVLRVKEEDETEETIGLNTLGTVVHEVLEDFYGAHIGGFPTTSDFNELLQNLKSKLDDAFEKNYPNGDTTEGKNHLIFQVGLQMLKGFLKQEQKREIVPMITGIEEGWNLKVDHPEFSFPLNFTGKIDRMEEVGSLVYILDYKTGTPKKSLKVKSSWEAEQLWKDENNVIVQLLLYKWMFWKNTGNAEGVPGVVFLRKVENGVMQLDTSAFSDQEELLNWFEEKLMLKLSEIFDKKEVFEDKRLTLPNNF